MPSASAVLLCAIAATLFWTCLGLPLARRLAPERPLALAIAPALGWAVFCPPAFLILWLAGTTRTTVAVLIGAALLTSVAALISANDPPRAATLDATGILWWGYAAAALLAVAPVLAVMPKLVGDGVILAAPIFDHSKVAIIDDIARLGVPPGNPFFGGDGASPRLAYYYLWHFGAALFAVLLGVSGWEADIALTGFTAFASLALMMGLAVWIGGRRAAFWVAAFSLTASLRPVLTIALGAERLGTLLSPDMELQAWIVQASWAPQHLAAATCAVLAVLLLSRLAERGDALTVPALALVVAAGFESSAWIGGVTVALAAAPVGIGLLVRAEPRRRLRLLAGAGAAALLAAAIALPFLHDEYVATAARASGWPIALRPYPVLGSAVPASVRQIVDLPAYWLLLLIVEFPAIYLAGSLTWARMIAAPAAPGPPNRLALGLGLLAAVGLIVGWLLVSTIANNDLGWRAVLPAVLVLTVFAAAALSTWHTVPRRLAAAAIGLLALGLVGGTRFIHANATGNPASSAAAFAQSPALWQAMRRHAAPDQRVGNNPAAFADMSVWPINISWALLADRRSCYAGWALAQAFVPLPGPEIDALEALFIRVFAGDGTADDVHRLATQYACHVIVVSAQDGAWRHDPFAANADYRLAEGEPGRWRIYVAVER